MEHLEEDRIGSIPTKRTGKRTCITTGHRGKRPAKFAQRGGQRHIETRLTVQRNARGRPPARGAERRLEGVRLIGSRVQQRDQKVIHG